MSYKLALQGIVGSAVEPLSFTGTIGEENGFIWGLSLVSSIISRPNPSFLANDAHVSYKAVSYKKTCMQRSFSLRFDRRLVQFCGQ